MTTPNEIKSLEQNEIFVFGSNLNGNHAGGAAQFAKDVFGAEEGIGEGLTGQCYAFPTLGKDMQKVSIDDLKTSKEKLYACALENKDKKFLVTKVGCGIAGFSEEEMKQVFSGDKPSNVILPAGWSIIRGFKAFEKGLICRGFQYEMGKEFRHDGALKLCGSGFHFCKNLGDVYSFYDFEDKTNIVAEIESEGDVVDEEDGTKSVTNHLRIVRILNAEEAANNNGIDNIGHSNTGNWNTGNRNTGHRNTGNWNTGDRNTGGWNTGYWNTGNWNTGNLNTGNWNTGDGNTGDMNTGHRNTGDRNTGHWNTGNWNTGDGNTGFFNTITPDEILIFNKRCSREEFNRCDKPNFIYFSLTEWIDFSDMTDDEKSQYPEAARQDGYLKKYDYKEAFQKSYNNASESDRAKIKNLPNFDKDIFFEISGIMVD